MKPRLAALATSLLFAFAVAASLSPAMSGCTKGGGTSDDLAMQADADHTNFDMAVGGPKDFTLTDDIGSTVGIACGDTPCPAAAGQTCCTSTQGKTGTCTIGPPTSCGSASFECDGPEDCPPATKYCCVASGVAQCVSGPCPGTTMGGFGMCHLNPDCALVGGTCCPSSTGGPYRLCLPNGCQ
jgi:hypothetical protein